MLLLAFRSVVIPLEAAVMNLLSVAAAYGAVMRSSRRAGAPALSGWTHAIPDRDFAPLLDVCDPVRALDGLPGLPSVEIQEHYHERARAQAVVDGSANTGRAITPAALNIVCVFTSFVLNGDPTVKEFGVGLAVAIATMSWSSAACSYRR